MVLFTRKRRITGLIPPRILNYSLNFSDEVKYLGITLDRKLTWNSHLDGRAKRAYIAYEQCRRTVGRTWGLTPRVIAWVYTAVIRPMLTYGAIAWVPKVLQATAINKLNHIQRMACINITGAMKTTPTAAMELIIGITPLDIYVKEVALVTMMRLRSAGANLDVGMGQLRTRFWRGELDALPVLQAGCDSIEPKFVFNKPYKIETRQCTETNVANAYCIYTDGSKMKEGSGCGIYSRSLNLRIKWGMGKNASVLQTELTGISIAAKEITQKGIAGKTIMICTDSRQALLTLNRPRVTSGLVMECHESLTQASDGNTIILKWVKGHNRNKGNRIADQLSRKAAGLRLLGPGDLFGWSTTTIAEIVKCHSHTQTVKRWEEGKGCRLARLTLSNLEESTSKKYLGMTRKNLRLAVGFLTGHCQLSKHLHTLGLVDTPLCRKCEREDETVEHVLCECPELSLIREYAFGESWPTPAHISEMSPGDLSTFLEMAGWTMS